MPTHLDPLRPREPAPRTPRLFRAAWAVALLGALSVAALGQTPVPQPESESTPATSDSTQGQSPAKSAEAVSSPLVATDSQATPAKDPLLTAGALTIQTKGGEISEEQIRQLLVGKTLYLRAGYLDNNLEFDEWGRLTGHSSQGSFTLSQIQINKVRLTKHRLELSGDRYGLHFLGAAPYEDPTKATDRVKITARKKTVHISFAREQIEKPKKAKHRKHKDDDTKESDKPSSETEIAKSDTQADKPAAFDQPSGDKVTRTTDPAHASQLLLIALDKVLSRGIDDRMIAAMPDFWKLYYQAAAQKTDYKPSETGVLFQNAVDQKAKLISAIDPPSNEFAQANGVAGMALYHAVVGSDGKVQTVVAGRPIGFGLDENAEQTIRKATFQPALKDGQPVPVALDLVVSFRIYSKRTSQQGTHEEEAQGPKGEPALPGPYTLQALEQAKSAQQDQAAAPQNSAETSKAPQ